MDASVQSAVQTDGTGMQTAVEASMAGGRRHGVPWKEGWEMGDPGAWAEAADRPHPGKKGREVISLPLPSSRLKKGLDRAGGD